MTPLVWRSRCGVNGSCVQVAYMPGGSVAVRDGKVPDTNPVLIFEDDEWSAFIAAVKAGEVD